jgi:RNase adapter protein RapZ
VDNLPVDLIPKFAELTHENPPGQRAALVVDVREGKGLKRFPEVITRIRHSVNAKLVFWKRTTRPLSAASAKPAGRTRWAPTSSIARSIRSERRSWRPSAPWPT